MYELGEEWILRTTPIKLKEIATPDDIEVPPDTLSLYAKDKAGVSALYYKDDAGVEHDLGAVITDHGGLGGLADDDHPQYHNDARANTWLATRSTSNLSEGTNLYYTNARVDARIALIPVNHGSAWSVLTNGDPVTPELLFDSNGEVLMMETLR